MEELRFSEYCANCRKSLAELERILFVEKEIGRCFCTETCIQDYFQPTIDSMEEELAKLRSNSDLRAREPKDLAHYRGLTLGDPDEIWVQELESGEKHFTFISQFRHGEGQRFSCIAVCLAIEGIPSFVFLAFLTKDDDLVDAYRRGVDMRLHEPSSSYDFGSSEQARPAEPTQPSLEGDTIENIESGERPGLSEHATTFANWYSEGRRSSDIPREAFEKFEPFIEPVIDDPDEIWNFVDDEKNEWCTFIAKFRIDDPDQRLGEDEEEGGGQSNQLDSFTMIVVCDKKTLEVVFSVPTTDPTLVQRFRKGINSLNKAFGVGWARGRAA
ncbi:MAG: hypothetical protein AB1540_05090 [Bdellovibrionota bacterium]